MSSIVCHASNAHFTLAGIFDTFLKAIASSNFFNAFSLHDYSVFFIISINVFIISFASSVVFPFKTSIIIDVDACDIAQP